MVKQQIAQLLEKEMDRRDFLRHIGVAFLALVGVSTFIQMLTKQQASSSHKSSGYGSNPYGK